MMEVAKLLRPPARCDGWRVNRRPPTVGDRGTIVDVLHAAGRTGYIVEAYGPHGATLWLGVFDRGDLRPVGDAR